MENIENRWIRYLTSESKRQKYVSETKLFQEGDTVLFLLFLIDIFF